MKETFPTNQPIKEGEKVNVTPQFVRTLDGTLMRVGDDGKLTEDQKETLREQNKDLSV